MPFGGSPKKPPIPDPSPKVIDQSGEDIKERIKRARGRSGTLFSRGMLFQPTVNNTKLGGG